MIPLKDLFELELGIVKAHSTDTIAQKVPTDKQIFKFKHN
jgi:hypothetical protein